MTQEITAEQAPQIHDLESYKTVTGAKRFKRTAEEMAMDLSPEQALKQRLAAFGSKPITNVLQAKADAASYKPWDVQAARKSLKLDGNGEIIIRIRPAKGVSPDYFEHLPKAEILVVEDDKFYGWLDVMLSGRYTGTVNEFFAEVLDEGLGEKISYPQYAVQPEAVNDNPNPH